jgi:hypothetical protein
MDQDGTRVDVNGRAEGFAAQPAGAGDPSERLRRELLGGLLYCHHRENTNTERVLEVAKTSSTSGSGRSPGDWSRSSKTMARA